MEIEVRRAITQKVSEDRIFALRPIIDEQLAIRDAQPAVNKTQRRTVNREYLEGTQANLITEINNQFDEIEIDYRTAIGMGVDPSEASVRKQVQQAHLALGILLTKKDNPTLFPRVKVKMYIHPQDGGIVTPVSRNRVEIIFPNPDEEDSTKVISTKLNNLADAMKAAANNTEFNSHYVYKYIISAQKRETIEETDDEFINRRFIELDNLRIFMKNGSFDNEVDLKNKISRTAIRSQLIKMWLQRRGSSTNHESILGIGYVDNGGFSDNLEIRLTSARKVGQIRIPLVRTWYETTTQRKIMALLTANGVERPEDYDFITHA